MKLCSRFTSDPRLVYSGGDTRLPISSLMLMLFTVSTLYSVYDITHACDFCSYSTTPDQLWYDYFCSSYNLVSCEHITIWDKFCTRHLPEHTHLIKHEHDLCYKIVHGPYSNFMIYNAGGNYVTYLLTISNIISCLPQSLSLAIMPVNRDVTDTVGKVLLKQTYPFSCSNHQIYTFECSTCVNLCIPHKGKNAILVIHIMHKIIVCFATDGETMLYKMLLYHVLNDAQIIYFSVDQQTACPLHGDGQGVFQWSYWPSGAPERIACCRILFGPPAGVNTAYCEVITVTQSRDHSRTSTVALNRHADLAARSGINPIHRVLYVVELATPELTVHAGTWYVVGYGVIINTLRQCNTTYTQNLTFTQAMTLCYEPWHVRDTVVSRKDTVNCKLHTGCLHGTRSKLKDSRVNICIYVKVYSRHTCPICELHEHNHVLRIDLYIRYCIVDIATTQHELYSVPLYTCLISGPQWFWCRLPTFISQMYIAIVFKTHETEDKK